MKIIEAERAINYTFKDKKLLTRALTLASADLENNNQLLEFFGDAILEFIVSERIFGEGESEGALTERRKNIVSDKALAPVSKKLGLDKLLIRGKRDDGNKKAIPSAYEAVVAAIYLDGGLDAAKRFVLSTLDFSEKQKFVNYKGELQELLQSSGRPVPEYECEDVGTPQAHKFVVTVRLFGEEFTGEAGRISEAEQLAAQSALNSLQKK